MQISKAQIKKYQIICFVTYLSTICTDIVIVKKISVVVCEASVDFTSVISGGGGGGAQSPRRRRRQSAFGRYLTRAPSLLNASTLADFFGLSTLTSKSSKGEINGLQ